jgi:hypothetical protein
MASLLCLVSHFLSVMLNDINLNVSMLNGVMLSVIDCHIF